MNDCLTLAEVATRLRVSRRTVQRLIADGRLRCFNVGAKRLVTDRELDAFIRHAESRRRVA